MSHNSPTPNNNDTEVIGNNEQVENFEDFDTNTWTASGKMQKLPTRVFRGNVLMPTIRKTILQTEPRNKDISFEPPVMDKKLWTNMSCNTKKHDISFRRTVYRFSAVIRPIDNAL
jgi:hypothetical protein